MSYFKLFYPLSPQITWETVQFQKTDLVFSAVVASISFNL